MCSVEQSTPHAARNVSGNCAAAEQATAAARSCFVDVAVQDQRSSLMAKYYKTDKAYQAQNFELTDEYRRITEQFKDLQVPLLLIANRSMSNSLL